MRENVGNPEAMEQLITFPEPNGTNITDTGEGGLAIFFVIIKNPELSKQRQLCLAGSPEWGIQDSVLSDSYMQTLNDNMYKHFKRDEHHHTVSVDLAMLVGSTKKSLWLESTGHYFKPKYKDLTKKGKELYTLLAGIYKEKPRIVTLLDT